MKDNNLPDRDIRYVRETAYDLYFVISETFKDTNTVTVTAKDSGGAELYKVEIERKE